MVLGVLFVEENLIIVNGDVRKRVLLVVIECDDFYNWLNGGNVDRSEVMVWSFCKWVFRVSYVEKGFEDDESINNCWKILSKKRVVKEKIVDVKGDVVKEEVF